VTAATPRVSRLTPWIQAIPAPARENAAVAVDRSTSPTSDARLSALRSDAAEPAPPVAVSFQRGPKTGELVAREIVGQIIDRRLPEGTRLPPERELAAEFGIGRATMREALRLLESRGVLKIQQGASGGPVVVHPSVEHLARELTLTLQFEGAALGDLLHVRTLVEPTLSYEAASHPASDDVAALRECVVTMSANLDSHDVFLAQERRLVAIIARMSGSITLGILTEAIRDILQRAIPRVKYTPERRQLVVAAQQEIVEAIADQDQDRAWDLTRTLVTNGIDYWLAVHKELAEQPISWGM
jgi:GntR family transcriptional regulator, transcriptional repressor for pyruvate dehydrogenase complex